MTYLLVEAGSKSRLEEQVNALLATGWELYGGVAFVQQLNSKAGLFNAGTTLYDAGFMYAQAMIKHEE